MAMTRWWIGAWALVAGSLLACGLAQTLSLLNAERILARAYYSPALHQKSTDYPTIGGSLPVTERLKSITVALERLRWMGDAPRGARHIWVNQPDFVARIIDNGRTSFQTRVVIGKNVEDQRSPEFSDEMEHMVINPSWGVPRSITVKEYLPLLQQDPTAVAHLDIIDNTTGQIVPRESVDFAAFTDSTFPFLLRQAPSDDNALGKVKFMFPNEYNIYIHDTPARGLFEKETRALSHGCIRIQKISGYRHNYHK